MSTTTENPTTVDAQSGIESTQRIAEARYTFKTTVANKTENMAVYLTPKTKLKIENLVVNHPAWRSNAQFVVDALVYYLNDDDAGGMTAYEVIEDAVWTSESVIPVSITKELFNEIDLLVNHAHTPWSSKQEFYICAIQSYKNADYPAVTQR